MLNQIAQIFQLAVNRTGLIQDYEGVVQRVTKEGQTFPVSCTDPTACNSERYRKAIPDQDRRGLAYVEQRGQATVGNLEVWGYTVTYPVRFIAWINGGAQSLENCGDVIAQAELNVINCLKQTKAVTADFCSNSIAAEIRDFRILQRNPGEIFQGLAYNDNQALYIWPYAYTAIDCNVIFQIPANCIEVVSPTVAEDCIEY